eukprot:3939497-Rhodomonas_salina.2
MMIANHYHHHSIAQRHSIVSHGLASPVNTGTAQRSAVLDLKRGHHRLLQLASYALGAYRRAGSPATQTLASPAGVAAQNHHDVSTRLLIAGAIGVTSYCAGTLPSSSLYLVVSHLISELRITWCPRTQKAAAVYHCLTSDLSSSVRFECMISEKIDLDIDSGSGRNPVLLPMKPGRTKRDVSLSAGNCMESAGQHS